MLKYYEILSHSRTEKIQEFVTTLNRLNTLEPQILAETESLRKNYQALKREQQNLQQSQAKRVQTLAKLDAELSSSEKRLAAMQEDRKRLEQVLSRVFQEINAQELAVNRGEFSKLKGQLPWPLKGKTLNNYGERRAGTELLWQGLQIGAKRGSEVIAVHHGQVVFSDYLRGQGLLLIIDHGAGFMSLYAHNDHLYKELGEWVDAGEVIAAAGNTGGRKDTALYFELRVNGKPTNPQVWLRPA